MLTPLIKKSLPPLLVLFFVMGIHYFITYEVLDPTRRFLLPPPHSIIYEGFFIPKHRDEILRGLFLTTRVSFYRTRNSIPYRFFYGPVDEPGKMD